MLIRTYVEIGANAAHSSSWIATYVGVQASQDKALRMSMGSTGPHGCATAAYVLMDPAHISLPIALCISTSFIMEERQHPPMNG